MTAKSEVLDKIRRCFSIWSTDLKLNSKVNRLSDNISSESIAAGLLNLIFGYDLRNANEIHPNHEAVDLVDQNAENGDGVAVQISSTNSRPKALRTMEGFCKGEFSERLCDRYTKLIFLILSTDEKFKNWDRLVSDEYTLSILNLTDLSNAIEYLELERLNKILNYLNEELQMESAKTEQPRDRVCRIAHILDQDAIAIAAGNATEDDIDKFYMVDLNFPLMLRVISKGQDIPHPQMNDRLMALCSAGSPVILTGRSGTGKSAIMLRAAVSWAREGRIALWLSLEENTTLNDAEAAQFYQDVLSIIPAGKRALLCLDSPSRWPAAFSALGRRWPRDSRLQLLMAERANHLSRITDPNSDLLHHWFDGAAVAALMFENKEKPLRIKDYPVEYIPENDLRKQKILTKAVAVMFRRGVIQQVSEPDAVTRIMKDFGKNRVSLAELIYRAQFWLKDFATRPENLRMDWDEWGRILRGELNCPDTAIELYGVIALCHHFGIPATVSLFCRVFDLRERSLTTAIKRWRMDKHVEPVIYQEDTELLLPKHDVIAELFFLFHRDTIPVKALMADLLEAMNEYEIEDFLEKIVRKGPIQKGDQFPVGKVRYRDHLMAIYRRVRNGTCGLYREGKARLALGLLYTVPKKDRRLGEQTLPLAAALDPGLDGSVLTASLYTEWGRLLADLNRKTAAEEKFRAVADRYPHQLHARTELGRLLANQKGREKEAEHFLLEAMQIDPQNLHPRTELGRLLAKQKGREKEAEQFLREAMQIDPKHIQSRTELGRLLANQSGREAEAEHFLKEIISIDPKNCHARVELARICSRSRNYAEAERLYREVLRLDPGNTYAEDGLRNLPTSPIP